MSAFSTYMGNELLDHILNAASWASPTNTYVALFNGSATLTEIRAGTFTNEISNTGTAYARATGTGKYGTPASRVCSNTADIAFAQATADYPGTVTYVAIVSVATYKTGEVYLAAALNTARTVSSGSTFKFKIGDLVFTFD